MAVVLGTSLTSGQAEAYAPVNPQAIEGLTRYCTACWRNARLPADRWDDCTQQVFTRLLERVSPDRWASMLTADGDERKECMRAIDAVKKRTQRDRKYVGLPADAADWRTEPTELREDRAAVAEAADRVLSPRQRRIVELSAGGWGVPDIANELGTTAERVSDEKYKAIRKLRSHFGAV
jgi:RNA polymerase sigma factor (sigma-70 family)